MSTKRLYQKEIEAKLDELDAKIAQLQLKAQQANADMQHQYEAQLSTLSQRREVAKHKLDELVHSSEAAWEAIKGGVEGAVDELQSAFDKAITQFQ